MLLLGKTQKKHPGTDLPPMVPDLPPAPGDARVKKGKEAYLYSAFYILRISQSAQAWITQFYLQIHHACLSFVCVHQMAPPLTEIRDI